MTLIPVSPSAGHGLTRRRGTAMVEMVLVLPILLFFLSLLFFFGRGLARVVRLHVIDRYEASRVAAQTYVVDVQTEWQLLHGDWQHANEEPFGPHAQNADTDQLNQTFLADRATDLDVDGGGVWGGGVERQAYLDAVEPMGDAGPFAERLLAYQPHSVSRQAASEYDESVPLWRRYAGRATHRHSLPYHDWALVNGFRVLTIRRSDILAWGYTNVDLVNGNALLLTNDTTARRRFLEVEQLVDRGDELEVWRRRWPHSANWAAQRDVYLADLDAELRALDPQPHSYWENYAGAILRFYTSFHGYGGPQVYLGP